MIRVSGLGKKFKLYARPWARVTEWLTLGRACRHDDFWALRDVCFDVGRGESLGVIGANGSGKSTLLKILCGALYPTHGSFEINGRVLSLLELGTGLNPELTGRQNVINSSRLLTFGEAYAVQKMPEIEAFADLTEGFFDRPVKLYSSGMLVRLVFSMFACFDPDVFVIDEALAVGDVFFQQKCARRLQAMRASGVTMLFVSHDLGAVEALCDRVLLLHHGEVKHLGDKAAGIRMYYAVSGAAARPAGGAVSPLAPAHATVGRWTNSDGLARESSVDNSPISLPAESAPSSADPDWRALPWQSPDAADEIGDGRVRVVGICFAREDGSPEPVVRQGEWLDIFVHLRAEGDAPVVNGGLALYDRFDRLLFARGWVNADVAPASLRAGDEVFERFRVKMDLEPSEYIVSLGAGEALPRPDVPGGWDQEIGGVRYAELRRAAKVAVLPRADRRRSFYGPAPLQSEVMRVVRASAISDANVADASSDLSKIDLRLTISPGGPA